VVVLGESVDGGGGGGGGSGGRGSYCYHVIEMKSSYRHKQMMQNKSNSGCSNCSAEVS
jgi:hypothetical protein